jgi:DNA adenine methylase
MTSIEGPKPFVKWAGGKRQLLDILVKESPEKFNNYYEPFVGGGALYFKLWSTGKIRKAYLNDSNAELVNTYRIIQKRLSELIEELKTGKYENNSTHFYEIRGKELEDDVERAARFIYLNKTAYNGLYRVNSNGGFNVPYGKYSNPKILDEENLQLVNESLKHAVISLGDFKEILSKTKKKDYAYFDPPYHPLNNNSFTKYTKNDFTFKDQERLQKLFTNLTKKEVYTMLSNSDTIFIRDLYKNHIISEVHATRQINCKADKRGKITELLIKGVDFNEI